MSTHQAIARKYRPQRFSDVLAQDVLVTSLKNAIRYQRIPQALLLCGPAGSGKTTLARLFAKALNCLNPGTEPGSEHEPCNQCASCREINQSTAVDVIEIDGASNRGIDDIRTLNETAGYASSYRYKVYIIDEVHMLTKEAFNALLKTLEEPPSNVLFIFATTEAHKIPATIISRCQRYTLKRIPNSLIVQKLTKIAAQQNCQAETQALLLLAKLSEGGLRDAESLLDQVIAFQGERITTQAVASILGIVPRDVFFELDEAGKHDNLSKAFEIIEKVFNEGKNLSYFTESLLEHFRTLLLMNLGGKEALSIDLSQEELERYRIAASYYSREQCIWIIDLLLDAQTQMRHAPSKRFFLEALLMRIIRSHRRLPLPVLIERLTLLENKLEANPNAHISQIAVEAPPPPPPSAPQRIEIIASPPEKVIVTEKPLQEAPIPQSAPKEAPIPQSAPKENKQAHNKQAHLDTKLQFAAALLEGTVQKTRG